MQTPRFAFSLLAISSAVLFASSCVSISGKALPEGSPTVPATATAGDVKTSRAALISEVERLLADERFFNAHWGVLIESLDSGEVWYDLNGDRLFIPASNQKIPTSAAAILSLGPDFRFTTTLAYHGNLEDGRIDGDLVVFGTGDPTHYDRWLEDSRDDFREWARLLKGLGIRQISGNVIGDDNAWDDTHIGAGWPFDDLTPWYYAEYGALNFNENYVDIEIIPPATVDGAVQLVPNVPSSYFTLINEVRVVESGQNFIRMSRPHFSNEITISGTVVAGSDRFEQTPTITNPTLFHVTVLKEVLEEEGIRVTGMAVDCDDIEGWDKKPEDLSVLHVHQSPPLSEILSMLFKRSQNMYSEVMIYTMGWQRTGFGTFSNGRREVQDQLERLGVARDGYRFSDGSGLSRFNLISPRIINQINRAMLDTEHAELWLDIQAIAGVDGTLRNRMRDTAAQGNLRGKTGTLGAVRALSGYVTTASGERMLFSMLVNSHMRGAGEVDEITDAIALLLAEFEG